ncbi:MAG: U32 family peptidase C-terminal domain-containing protein [Bdellovibrionaceae bacterium]|nr:U32 family peptidase C-terminal domain-containing protein [Pseudobdellovibrionaceae bacterium]
MVRGNLELLMPAGSSSKLELALDYGADAVYLGPPFYSLRARENDFQKEKLKESIASIHGRGKKVYMTLNIFSRNRKLKSFEEDVVDFAEMKPDAFIMSDPGLGSIARELAPQIPIHLSTQANCMNWQSVKFWQKTLNVQRIILSRELSIAEISEIHKRVPEMELEAFVHGSICIAYSGRCLLSSYMNNRDANQGVCDNSCREKFQVSKEQYYIEDIENNPNQHYPIEEDEHGTYILNAKDLCMVEHLQALANAGVVSFKVEGRTKSEFYSAMVARAYRGALDDLRAGRPFNSYWKQELEKLSHRGFHTAFMFNDAGSEGQNYKSSIVYNHQHKLLGLVRDVTHDGLPIVDIKNKIEKGQRVRWLSPDGEDRTVTIANITRTDGRKIDVVHSGSGLFYMQIEGKETFQPRSLIMTYAEDRSH